jgi:basic membrane lipoprotein Med (substrate-binding protein (PBP1-ABC) superfamily)
MPAGGRARTAARGQRRPSRGRRGSRWAAGVVSGIRRWWGSLRRVQRRVVAACGLAAVVVVAGLLVWLGLSGGPAPRSRQYLAFTACLLTDSRGLASAQAARVWLGMQDASLATRAKVEYLPVMSGDSAGAAAPYVASLLQRHCGVVVATGAAQVAAVSTAAREHPSVEFVAVGGAAASPHVTTVRAAAGSVRAQVAALVTAAVDRAG